MVEGSAPRRAPLRGDEGTQSLEYALTLPLVALALLLVCGAGLLGAEVVAVHGVARDAARTAAVAGSGAAHEAAREVAGGRELEIDVLPSRPRAGEIVTATVRMRSRALAALGLDVWLPAQVAMPVEPS